MWPTSDAPHFGAFVASQVRSLCAHGGIECDVAFARRDYRELRRSTVERVKAWKPDLVHAHFGYSAAAVAVDCRRLGVPLVVSYCGGDLHGEVGGPGRRAKTSIGVAASVAAGFLARRLVVKSESMLAYLPAVLRRRTRVIPNGVDLDRFVPLDRQEAKRRLGWDPAETVVLFGGRVDDPTKNFRLAEAGFAIARPQLGGKARLAWLSGVDPATVPLWLNAADAVVLTSLKEGSPNIVKEACACDVPVVSTAVGDVPVILEGVPNARVVGLEAHEVAAAIVDVVRHCAATGGGRRGIIERKLDDRSIAQRLIALYREVLPCA